jgi:hypothetical protein
VIATGTIAGLLLGAGGVAVGARAGRKLDQANASDPAHDPYDQFFYHEALREGNAILMALADTPEQAEQMRAILAKAGAKDLDAARVAWWSTVRNTERAAYDGDFARDEQEYQKGFEAAFEPARRGQPLDVGEDISVAYRKGYDRGCEYFRKRLEHA